MKKSIAPASVALALAFVLSPAPVRAEQTLRDISWAALKSEGSLLGGDVVPGRGAGATESLRVENPGPGPRLVPLFVVVRPGITARRYALRGTVAADGVEGAAYLEMWNFFPGGGAFFSRTLAGAGPMANLGGTFAPRPFVLPFTSDAPGHGPEKLAINVAFPGKGTVVLGSVRLVQLDERDDFFATPGAWLTPSEIGRAGGLAGGVLGLLGAVIGILASRRVARPLVVGLLYALVGFGVAALAAGAFAWLRGQPWEVTFPLLLIGALAAAIPGGLLGPIRRQYEELEFRRMSALDAG